MKSNKRKKEKQDKINRGRESGQGNQDKAYDGRDRTVSDDNKSAGEAVSNRERNALFIKKLCEIV